MPGFMNEPEETINSSSAIWVRSKDNNDTLSATRFIDQIKIFDKLYRAEDILLWSELLNELAKNVILSNEKIE